jgi:hypothetical protein
MNGTSVPWRTYTPFNSSYPADHPAASRPDTVPLANGPVNEAGQLQAFDIGSLQSPCAVCPVFRLNEPTRSDP